MIQFVVVIDADGHFIQFEDVRTQEGKKRIGRKYALPKGVKRSSGIKANVLWDNAAYLLGIDEKGKIERLQEQKACFIETFRAIFAELENNTAINAIERFYQHPWQRMQSDPLWAEIEKEKPNLTFRLATDAATLVLHRPEIIKCYQKSLNSSENKQVHCLVSGEKAPLAVTHPVIKGVWGAQTSGANIVSFNQESFCSWGRWKQQGANAPVGEKAAFEYTTALNHLLQTGSPNRLQLGDASVVFWAQDSCRLVQQFPSMVNDLPKDNPDSGIEAIKELHKTLYNGAWLEQEGKQRFYLLGLAPNAARIAIRFWQVATVADFAANLRQWFEDIAIVNARLGGLIPLKPLLRSTAALNKDENLSPPLVSSCIRAILSGQPLPDGLCSALLTRLKAEPGRINDYRAALLKAWLNRKFRLNSQKEITVALNKEDTRTGYLLGRLFAVLEKLQSDASPGLNATISDRYYSSATCTPIAVFPTLIRLHHHHLRKLEKPAYRIAAENRIQSIMGEVKQIPRFLNQENQCLFALGYYQQRQDLFTKKESTQGEDA
ncbi:MAG: type I-C CRISPR-associated protein Cas8c/Csd1 [Enterobacteriaceae bacterium]